MRTFARISRALAALLPHNHGRLSQPSRHTRFYAHPAGESAAELEERLIPEFAALARQRSNAHAETAEFPEALAHNAMADPPIAKVAWMDRADIVAGVGIEYVEAAA